MSIKLSDSIRVGQQKPLEDKYFNELVPYTSTSQVNTLLPKPVRHIGLTVNINREEYWYKDGIEDANLVLKIINSTALDDKLNKGGYGGTAGDLNNQILSLSQSLQNEQSARVNADLLKQDKLSSYDESILIEDGGNIEGNISLFEEYFEQQECELNFTPIQIVAVYQDGIKLLNSEYEIILPKKIRIKEYVDENIQIEYTHLKS